MKRVYGWLLKAVVHPAAFFLTIAACMGIAALHRDYAVCALLAAAVVIAGAAGSEGV